MGFLKLRDDSIVKGMARLMEQVKAGQLEIDVLKLSFYPCQMLGTLFLAFTQRALLEVFSDLPFLDFLCIILWKLTAEPGRIGDLVDRETRTRRTTWKLGDRGKQPI